MMPGAMPMRGPPGQGPRTSTGMRGSMGRGDYGKWQLHTNITLLLTLLETFKMILSLLVSQVTIPHLRENAKDCDIIL